MKSLVALAIFVTTLMAGANTAQAQALPLEGLDKIAAVVEEDVILQSELDRAVGTVLAQYQRNPQQLPPRDVLERQVLERLVMLKLQVQRAEGTGIRVNDTEVDQAAARLAQQNKMDIRTMRTQMERDGFSFDDFRKTLREELLVQRLRQRVVQSKVNVTDSEVDIALAGNSMKTGEVHLMHILVGVPENATPPQIQSAREKAEKVKKEIDGGMDFSAAAIRYSEGQNALEGGDLGWRKYNEVPEMFADLITGIEAGQTTPPVRGPSGFHILKLVEKRAQGKQVVNEVHARHILIKVSELVNSEEALRSVRNLRKRLVESHDDFAKLAKEFSEDETTANNGGDMGWFQTEQYGTRVAEVLKTLKDDEISEPFQTELGWHIMARLGTRDSDRTQDYLRAQAKDTIRNRKAEEEYETFLHQIRSEAFVDIRLPPATSETAGKSSGKS